MGAPPPTSNNGSVWVNVRIETRRIRAAKTRAQMWTDVEKVLRCWGYDSSGAGNQQNGLRFEFQPPGAPPEAREKYSVRYGGATEAQRNKFLGAYKKVREELEKVAKKHGAYVNEWNDVFYGTKSLKSMYGQNTNETGTPQEPEPAPGCSLPDKRATKAAPRIARRTNPTKRKKPS